MECAICLERYDTIDRQPRILPCSGAHELCSTCVELLQQRKPVSCPTCREILHPNAQANVNRGLLAALEELRTKSDLRDQSATAPDQLTESTLTRPRSATATARKAMPAEAAARIKTVGSGFRTQAGISWNAVSAAVEADSLSGTCSTPGRPFTFSRASSPTAMPRQVTPMAAVVGLPNGRCSTPSKIFATRVSSPVARHAVAVDCETSGFSTPSRPCRAAYSPASVQLATPLSRVARTPSQKACTTSTSRQARPAADASESLDSRCSTSGGLQLSSRQLDTGSATPTSQIASARVSGRQASAAAAAPDRMSRRRPTCGGTSPSRIPASATSQTTTFVYPARFPLAAPPQIENRCGDLHDNLEIELVFLEGQNEFLYDQMAVLGKAHPFAGDASIQALTRHAFGLEDHILKARQQLESLALKHSDFHALAGTLSPAINPVFDTDRRKQEESVVPHHCTSSSPSARAGGQACCSQQLAVSDACTARHVHGLKKGSLAAARSHPTSRAVEHRSRASGNLPVNAQKQQGRKMGSAKKKGFVSIGAEAPRSGSTGCKDFPAAKPIRQLAGSQVHRNTWMHKEVKAASVQKTAPQHAEECCNSSETAFESVKVVHDLDSSEPASCLVQ